MSISEVLFHLENFPHYMLALDGQNLNRKVHLSSENPWKYFYVIILSTIAKRRDKIFHYFDQFIVLFHIRNSKPVQVRFHFSFFFYSRTNPLIDFRFQPTTRSAILDKIFLILIYQTGFDKTLNGTKCARVKFLPRDMSRIPRDCEHTCHHLDARKKQNYDEPFAWMTASHLPGACYSSGAQRWKRRREKVAAVLLFLG